MTIMLRVPRSTARAAGWIVTVGVLASGIGACSGGGSTSTTTPSVGAAGATGQPEASGQPAASGTGDRRGFGGQGGAFRGLDQAQVQKIRECLSAAGIELPSARPFPSGRPSGFPTDGSRPSGFPTGGTRPSGFPSDGQRGGVGGVLTSPEAKAALEACGIVLPTFSPRPRTTTTGSPTAVAPTAG